MPCRSHPPQRVGVGRQGAGSIAALAQHATEAEERGRPDLRVVGLRQPPVRRGGAGQMVPRVLKELDLAWRYFERPDLHELSATDAVSFVLMTQRKITSAFTFDAHFATAGFRIVG